MNKTTITISARSQFLGGGGKTPSCHTKKQSLFAWSCCHILPNIVQVTAIIPPTGAG